MCVSPQIRGTAVTADVSPCSGMQARQHSAPTLGATPGLPPLTGAALVPTPPRLPAVLVAPGAASTESEGVTLRDTGSAHTELPAPYSPSSATCHRTQSRPRALPWGLWQPVLVLCTCQLGPKEGQREEGSRVCWGWGGLLTGFGVVKGEVPRAGSGLLPALLVLLQSPSTDHHQHLL